MVYSGDSTPLVCNAVQSVFRIVVCQVKLPVLYKCIYQYPYQNIATTNIHIRF